MSFYFENAIHRTFIYNLLSSMNSFCAEYKFASPNKIHMGKDHHQILRTSRRHGILVKVVLAKQHENLRQKCICDGHINI